MTEPQSTGRLRESIARIAEVAHAQADTGRRWGTLPLKPGFAVIFNRVNELTVAATRRAVQELRVAITQAGAVAFFKTDHFATTGCVVVMTVRLPTGMTLDDFRRACEPALGDPLSEQRPELGPKGVASVPRAE